MRRRRTVRMRFIMIISVLVFGLAYLTFRIIHPPRASEGMVTLGEIGDNREVEAFIVRSETVFDTEGYGRVRFVAREGSQVSRGDLIATAYAAGYREQDWLELEKTRGAIRDHYVKMLDRVKNPELEKLDADVTAKSVELKRLINRQGPGSLINLERQLEVAMQARLDYIRANFRDDVTMNELLAKETWLQRNLDSWVSNCKADKDGLVSFYVDGYESLLKPEKFDTLTMADLRSVQQKKPVTVPNQPRGTQPLYRLVSNDSWYVLLILREKELDPVIGQNFKLRMVGFEDVIYTGTMDKLRTAGNETLALLKISEPMGSMLGVRSGRASVGSQLQGLKVPLGALTNEAGQDGVRVASMAGGDFVAVEVLARDGQSAVVRPLVAGALVPNQRVLLFD